MVNGPLTNTVAQEVAEQLTMLEADSEASVEFLMSNVSGGDIEAGRATYDLIRTVAVPVTVLGSGLVAGPGVLAFVGPPKKRRYGLPHFRVRLEDPKEAITETGRTVEDVAEAMKERRDQIVRLLAEATGQSAEQIATDLASARRFDAEEAQQYGLIDRVVQGRQEIQ